ncbi:hypothetical protein ACLOJK_014804 [Asimina triloba]
MPLSSFPRPHPSSARPGLDDPGRSSCHTADPRCTTQPAQPTCCRTSITRPPVVATPTSIGQLQRTTLPRSTATARHTASLARCQLPAILQCWHVGMGVARPHRPTATADVPALKMSSQ